MFAAPRPVSHRARSAVRPSIHTAGACPSNGGVVSRSVGLTRGASSRASRRNRRTSATSASSRGGGKSEKSAAPCRSAAWTQISRVRSHGSAAAVTCRPCAVTTDRKSTRLNSSHPSISYAVFCLKKKKKNKNKKYKKKKKKKKKN